LASRHVRAALERSGLAPYEQKAYLALLQCGAMTARGANASAEIPYSKAYVALGRLEAKGWADSSGEGLVRYHPRPPQIAARTSACRIRAELQEAEKVVLDELRPLSEENVARKRPDIWIVHGEFSVLTKLHELSHDRRTPYRGARLHRRPPLEPSVSLGRSESEGGRGQDGGYEAGGRSS